MSEETTSAIVVKNTLPVEIIAIAPEAIEKAKTLTANSGALQVVDAPSLETANELYKEIDALAKGIASNRLEITRPIDILKKQIIAAEETVTQPLLAAKSDLGKRMVTCQKELSRQREEAERQAREEAEKNAAEERIRLEAERQQIIAENERVAAEARKKAEEEAALLGFDIEDAEIMAAPPPPPVVVVPVVIPPTVPEAPKSAARVTTRQKLVIFDESLIPIVHAGVILRIPDPKAIEKLLKAGVQVPGCRLESVESVGAAGGRR